MTPTFRSMLLTARTATKTLARPSYVPSTCRAISSTRAYTQDQPSSSNTEEASTSSPSARDSELEQTSPSSSPIAEITTPPHRTHPYTLKTGTVTSVGLMDKTVRVAHRHTEWDRRIRKPYRKATTYLVSDPRNSLREGDVIEFSSGAPRSRRVRHVVERILAPFGEEISARPAVMTREERDAERMHKRALKLARKAERVAASTGQDVEAVTRRFVESQEHMGRIRSLVMKRMS